MSYTIVTDETDYPIQPRDINTNCEHFWNAFGDHDTEISAQYIVRLCQKHGSWRPFTREEIERFYNERRRKSKRPPAGVVRFHFNGLVHPQRERQYDGLLLEKGGGWIVEKDGLLYVTDNFIERCYNSSPAREIQMENAT